MISHMSRSWEGGSTRAWRALRANILAANRMNNRGRCCLAIQSVCTEVATEVHHMRGKAYGDRAEDLLPSCKACNLHVGQPGKVSPQPKKISNW
jgi:hypothetical protein